MTLLLPCSLCPPPPFFYLSPRYPLAHAALVMALVATSSDGRGLSRPVELLACCAFGGGVASWLDTPAGLAACYDLPLVAMAVVTGMVCHGCIQMTTR